jgi:GNAT superfamily N-acetyltransferase
MVQIEEWHTEHERWPELLRFVAEVDQTDWVEFTAVWHLRSHMLVATQDEMMAGFLRFVVQEIGADTKRPSVIFYDKPLIEVKVLAFAVAEPFRNQGIGRTLQISAIEKARQMGCYQIRSHSSGKNKANHHLKLSMGFAVHPVVRDSDESGVYFVMPLQHN